MTTRREFLLSAGAAGALSVSVSLPLLLRADGGLAPTARAAAGVLALPVGLPPTSRLEQLRCTECNDVLGQVLVDELDAAAPVVCDECHREAVAEAENDRDEFDSDDLQDELDDEREAHETLKQRYAVAVVAFDQVRWQLRDLETNLAPTHAAHARAVERMRERLEEAVVPVVAS